MTTTNIPNVHEHDRAIPAGKVLICEPRALPAGEARTRREVLDTRTAWGTARVDLIARFPGWACAGSMMRWDNGAYGVIWTAGGSSYGNWYRTFDEALAHFQRLPAEAL
jgi:hypothetical protein